jgi:hypothetical protein
MRIHRAVYMYVKFYPAYFFFTDVLAMLGLCRGSAHDSDMVWIEVPPCLFIVHCKRNSAIANRLDRALK